MDQLLVCNGQLLSNNLIIITFMYTGGKDYDSEPIVAKFDALTTNVSFSVSINEDDVLEANETFIIIIIIIIIDEDEDESSLTNNKITVGDPGQVTVTIVDNDSK